jgi:hypothetical protein
VVGTLRGSRRLGCCRFMIWVRVSGVSRRVPRGRVLLTGVGRRKRVGVGTRVGVRRCLLLLLELVRAHLSLVDLFPLLKRLLIQCWVWVRSANGGGGRV